MKNLTVSLIKINKGEPLTSIICNKKSIEIPWEKTININDENALVFESGFSKISPFKRTINKIILHWDVCQSAKSCFKNLIRRDCSSHFCIDNDGTIFQFLDTMHKAWHCSEANGSSIGIDISTAYDLKFQENYIKNFGIPKPVVTNARVQGHHLEPFLGFYPVQLEALKALLVGLVKYYKIPLRSPKTDDGVPLTGFSDSCLKSKGIFCHCHMNPEKIDIPNEALDLPKLIEDLRVKFAETKESK